jgi:hypothetical protein
MINAIKEYDVVFLSYKEENKETNWNRLKKMIPKAKRVDGVKGFDAAHRAVGEASSTERTVVVDGDNWLNDDALFDIMFKRSLIEGDQVVSYASINMINSLIYGNGGVKVWPTELLRASSSHEFAEFGRCVDFVYNENIKYLQQNKIISSTVQNSTPEQAFTAGYREGVKLSMDLTGQARPIIKFYLNTWGSIGSDVRNGEWAIMGARLGVHDSLFLNKFDHTSINDLDFLYDKARSFDGIQGIKKHVNSILDYELLKNVYGLTFTDFTSAKSEKVKWLTKRIPRAMREDKVW